MVCIFLSVAAGTCSPSRCLVTAVVCLLISRSLHSNGSTRYSILDKAEFKGRAIRAVALGPPSNLNRLHKFC
jgi:hypothetical protein